MSAPDDALDPIVERADDRETWIGIAQGDQEDREFDMAELQRLRATVAAVEAREAEGYALVRMYGHDCPTCGTQGLASVLSLGPILRPVENSRSDDWGTDIDDMCPNCITPWKCNGPHIPDAS